MAVDASALMAILPNEPGADACIAALEADGDKGVHPAALNFGDCFAYEVAKEHGCPLLHVGEDFARTDTARAI